MPANLKLNGSCFIKSLLNIVHTGYNASCGCSLLLPIAHRNAVSLPATASAMLKKLPQLTFGPQGNNIFGCKMQDGKVEHDYLFLDAIASLHFSMSVRNWHIANLMFCHSHF